MALTDEMERQGNWLFKHRGILPLIIFPIGFFLYLKNEATIDYSILETQPYNRYYETFCLLVSFLGLFIRIYTVGYTPANTSGRNTARQLADELNTTGIYSIVRNPLYVGNFFMWLGIAMLTANLWFVVSFILFYLLYYARIIFAEESFLKSKFGDVYINWTNRTPIIIPSFKSFVKPKYTFSWKKVLRQEKNGFTALFLIFCLFDVAGELTKKEQSYNEGLLIAGTFSILLYAILKFLKYNTKLLQD